MSILLKTFSLLYTMFEVSDGISFSQHLPLKSTINYLFKIYNTPLLLKIFLLTYQVSGYSFRVFRFFRWYGFS